MKPAHGIRLPLILVLVSAALAMPAVISGWMNDDHFFDTTLYETDAPFGYYKFMDRFDEAQLQPWWVSPDYELRFLRPLASLTLHLDFTLFCDSPLGAHIHSLLWSLVLLLGGFAVLSRVLPRRESSWAMVIFTFAICHAWGAGWIAARHAVLGGALTMWSAAFYLRWRAGEGKRLGAISLALFAVGLAAGEMALALAAFVFCYEVAGANGTWRERLLSLAPFAGVALAYVIAYKALGYGASGSGAYLDPMSQPGDYLAGLFPKTAAMLGSFGFGVPAMMRVVPGAESITTSAGMLVLLLLVAGLLLARKRLDADLRRSWLWLILAVYLPLLPGLAGLAQGREFVLSAVAFAGASSILLRSLLAERGAWYRRILPFGVAGLLMLGLFVVSPLSRLGQSFFIYKTAELAVQAGDGSKVDCPDGAPVYLINGDFMRSVLFPFVVARHQGITFPSWQQLVTPESDITVKRTATDKIVIASKDKPLVNDFLDLYRPAGDRLAVDDVIEIESLRAAIIDATKAGPTKIEFTIPGLATPDGACMLRYDDEMLHDWTPPALGESEIIEYVPPM
ncbi:MAG: hypothetical protein JRF63_14480 [Deltaproteobacteria bacterium]|nr:hypothetical protein [Deltaproteobacteria bacterium]